MRKGIFFSKPVVFLEILIISFFGFKVWEEFSQKRSVEMEVKKLEAEIEKLKTRDDDLTSLLEYAKTDSFVETEAREKLNLVQEGETLVIIPDADAEQEEKTSLASESLEVAKESNIVLWWKYFFDPSSL